MLIELLGVAVLVFAVVLPALDFEVVFGVAPENWPNEELDALLLGALLEKLPNELGELVDLPDELNRPADDEDELREGDE